MSISPVNVTRISQNFQTNFVLEAMRNSQRELFASQAQIATGRTFLRPSDNPIAAARTLSMTQALSRQNQFAANTEYGDSLLAAADGALTEINGLLIQASQIAIQTVGSFSTEDERESEAEVVASIRNQLQTVGNRQFNGRYIFGGRDVLNRPFVEALGGVAYVGDLASLVTRVSEDQIPAISVPGSSLFRALSERIAAGVDLSPSLSADTRLEDIAGANGAAPQGGVLIFNELGGVGSFRVDLNEADTIGGVIDRINAEAESVGAGLKASLTDTGITITPGALPVSVTDLGGGTTASDFGLYTATPSPSAIVGSPLSARVTRLTPIEDLAAGAGIDIESGFIVTNGASTSTIDISQAKTVQDIINTLNNSGTGVLARINQAGTGIDLFNTVSGVSLTIGENDGTTAADLGIRTMDESTPLTALNFGEGVLNAEGEPDLRIVSKNGDVLDVDLDGDLTLGDVIVSINEAADEAGVSVQASMATTGNGILIEDSSGGTDDLTISALNTDAAFDLGVRQSATGDSVEILGEDVNPSRTEGILGALFDLERALREDDTQGISAAGGRLDTLRNEVTRMHGIVGARSQAMASKKTQIQSAVQATDVFLSEIRDLDYAEAVTRLQSATSTLQASLQTSATLLNLSLMDFLR